MRLLLCGPYVTTEVSLYQEVSLVASCVPWESMGMGSSTIVFNEIHSFMEMGKSMGMIWWEYEG